MSSSLTELKEKASQLSETERAKLALSLIETLDGPANPDVEEAWRIEIERRVGQIERGEVEFIPGETRPLLCCAAVSSNSLLLPPRGRR